MKNLILLLAMPAGLVLQSDLNCKTKRPNVLIIMLDDMGYSDLGCYGGEINTPNIDRLAESGIRFTQMHNCARCCPSRASLLTGHYPQDAGINGMGVNLSLQTPTLAEILKENGYQTGMTGKWHLSQTKPVDMPVEQLRWLAHRADYGPFSPLAYYPCNRGFDEHWGNMREVAPSAPVTGKCQLSAGSPGNCSIWPEIKQKPAICQAFIQKLLRDLTWPGNRGLPDPKTETTRKSSLFSFPMPVKILGQHPELLLEAPGEIGPAVESYQKTDFIDPVFTLNQQPCCLF